MNPEALATLHAHLLPALAAAPSETRRLFHGRGRCWPGLEQLTVDWLQGVVLVALFKEPEAAQLEALKQLAAGTHTVRRLGAIRRAHPAAAASLPAAKHHRMVAGEEIDELTIVEGGLKYRVDLGRKQNTGLFLDMRYGRDWVRERRGQTGAEPVRLHLRLLRCGHRGRRPHVVNLDMSSAALSRGRDNHRLNGHDLAR
jgi:23S rRNA (cytosine1962-C5)-methyltransferase